MEDILQLKITKPNLENALKSQFGNNVKFTVTDNGDGSFTIKFDDTNRIYYVENSGNIIESANILEIGSAEELQDFRDDVNSGNTYADWYVYLANDITLDINEEWEPIGLYPMESTSPTSENNKPFKGTFDGCGHEINGIYINTTDKVQGLFGVVVNGKISNLGVGENCNITGGVGTGAIVGSLYDNSQIVNCYNKANIEAPYSMTGGIAGNVDKNCILRQCYNDATINGNKYVGGICGNLATNSKVEESYNMAIVKGSSHIGGISGYVQVSTVYMCYNKGEITGNSYIGGITGKAYKSSSLKSVYNIGNIAGIENYIGGIAGVNDYSDIIYDSYNIGIITGENTSEIGSIVGKVLGNSATKNCYYLENTVNGHNGTIVEGSTSQTSEELKKMTTILGSSFKEDTNNINNGFPILSWQ